MEVALLPFGERICVTREELFNMCYSYDVNLDTYLVHVLVQDVSENGVDRAQVVQILARNV